MLKILSYFHLGVSLASIYTKRERYGKICSKYTYHLYKTSNVFKLPCVNQGYILHGIYDSRRKSMMDMKKLRLIA